MQTYLITPLEVGELSRYMSNHMDERRIENYIRESENIDIKSALGDALFLDVHEHPEAHEILLKGGTYEVNDKKECIVGLKAALAYYAYARIVKNADNNVTRFGLVQKESEYSSGVEFKEKMMAYNDAYSIAESYLKDCVSYLKSIKHPLYKGNGGIKSHRIKFKIIGN